ncbi:MAG: hypothetical protein DHS20C17_27230 [Cyclobacteriaceae bacterium]|nr:MAG: hypothetical protein DHS20C17_27230 [Cyclobacteriaceae bacterium]
MKKSAFFILFIFLLSGTGFTASEVIPTSLKINIRNSLGNSEAGVSVTLYGNKEDFKKEENPVQQGLTNEKGMVTFKNLEAKVYFVAAEKGDMSNFGLGVQTNMLEAKKVNKVTIIIE